MARIPLWIFGLAVAGTILAGWYQGVGAGGGFLTGAVAAYFNFRRVQGMLNRMAEDARHGAAPATRAATIRLSIQFAIFVLGAFVIIEVSGFNPLAAVCGLLVFPVAALLNTVFEIIKYGNT